MERKNVKLEIDGMGLVEEDSYKIGKEIIKYGKVKGKKVRFNLTFED